MRRNINEQDVYCTGNDAELEKAFHYRALSMKLLTMIKKSTLAISNASCSGRHAVSKILTAIICEKLNRDVLA